MLTFGLQQDDIEAIDALTAELSKRYDNVESAEFHRRSRPYAEELPRRLREVISEYRLAEHSAGLLITGLPVDDAALGPTPADWRNKPAASPTLRHDIAFFLIAALLGEPIGWVTQQDGRIMHDIFPMRGYEHEQIGWGSEEDLTWHTEDAYHPLRTDYLGLMCLRNPDGVETTIADVADIVFDPETRAALFQERFRILPDDSHLPRNAAADADDGRAAALRERGRRRVERALDDPDRVAVLFGDSDSPYLRIDPHYMRGVQGEAEQRVLRRACAAIDAGLTGVALRPGDVFFLDNFRAVHGRRPFRAQFDGTDRWLRRLNVTRDLRKSRAFRMGAESRVIY